MSKITEIFRDTTSPDEKVYFNDLLPASFRDEEFSLRTPLEDVSQFLHLDLSVERLNLIEEHLWVAGRPMPPRPLNYQISVSREIIVDEKMDMHLVWGPGRRMHIKPLPQYLLSSHFWSAHLTCSGEYPMSCHCLGGQPTAHAARCKRVELSRLALGFLTSYIALIERSSDFRIAQEHNLLPHSLTWPQWRKVVQNLLENDATNLERINSRYKYGELRLSRLNKIYALSRADFFRGYRAKYQTYQELFHTYLAPITATTVYFALVLTAMQVGLATDQLAGSQAFHRASYGFTVLSILGPLVLIFLVIVIAAAHFTTNFLATVVFRKERLGAGNKKATQV